MRHQCPNCSRGIHKTPFTCRGQYAMSPPTAGPSHGFRWHCQRSRARRFSASVSSEFQMERSMSTKTSRVGAGVLAVAAVVLPGLLLSCDGVQFGESPPSVRVSTEAINYSQSLTITADSYIRAAGSNSNYNTTTALEVGAGASSNGTAHALLRFDTSVTIPPTSTVQSALLRVKLLWDCQPGEALEVRRLAHAWDPPTVTWNCASDTDGAIAGCVAAACPGPTSRLVRWRGSSSAPPQPQTSRSM